ncbi:MAG TPA: 50S ribosomal protein L23 [Elusimicrobiales bacterium]|nr:50S ribosomal protein L23 [Elusimicrobiales bacterium]
MSRDINSVLLRPILTEKSLLHKDKQNRYSFVVDKAAAKGDIRQAIEKLYKVKVEKVCTAVLPGKEHRMGRFSGHRPDWKKAMVTLKAGFKIDTTEAA